MLDLDYSDSDASDSEQIATAPPPTAQALPSPKKPSGLSAFLPKPKSRNHKDSQDRPKKIVVVLPKFDGDDDDDEDRPAKRARTDGGSGLSAMLPAPKRAGATKVDSAPVRDIVTEKTSKDIEREDRQNHNGVGEQEKESDVRKPNPVFVPQSVARKPIQPMSAFKKGPALKPKSEPTKPKVSLFGSGMSQRIPVSRRF
jgi:hypothetical protein